MKTISFFRKDYLRSGILAPIFNRPKSKKISISSEELKQEISTDDYREKVKSLIKQDLLLRYDTEAVEKGLEDLDIKIITEAAPQPEPVEKEEPAPVQKPPTPVARINKILTEEKQQEVWKVQNRIPKWFKNPNQYNSQILIAYMDLLGEHNSVPLYKLEARCRKIKTFKNNYSQMKIISERNHAKVFEEAGGRITLWEPVRDFVIKEFKQFKKRNNYS